MGRANYDDDGDFIELWRGAVDRAIKGMRGQAFLRELIVSLDALTEKILIADDIVDAHGSVCALGAVAKSRHITQPLDPENHDQLSRVFGIAPAMVREIEFMNDEYWGTATPEKRFEKIREWAIAQLAEENAAHEANAEAQTQ